MNIYVFIRKAKNGYIVKCGEGFFGDFNPDRYVAKDKAEIMKVLENYINDNIT